MDLNLPNLCSNYNSKREHDYFFLTEKETRKFSMQNKEILSILKEIEQVQSTSAKYNIRVQSTSTSTKYNFK